MPWKACNVEDEQPRFVAWLLNGWQMAPLCGEFDISRKTGYKIYNRYKDISLEELSERTRSPKRYANQLPFQVESRIVQLKRERPTWGAPKIRERLTRLYPDIALPAISTVHAVLDRHGLVKRRSRKRNRAKGTMLSLHSRPNALCSADYKGSSCLLTGAIAIH